MSKTKESLYEKEQKENEALDSSYAELMRLDQESEDLELRVDDSSGDEHLQDRESNNWVIYG